SRPMASTRRWSGRSERMRSGSRSGSVLHASCWKGIPDTAGPATRRKGAEAEPPEADALSRAIAAKLKGRRLPMIDRVEVYIVEEPQPRWLAFLNGEHDFLERLPDDFANIALPTGKTAPNLARRGINLSRVPGMELTYSYFAMKDPVVGGYTPEKVALRRAIVLGQDVGAEIAIARKSQAVPSPRPV